MGLNPTKRRAKRAARRTEEKRVAGEARITSRNQSRQFGGDVPSRDDAGRAPAADGGPPRVLQNTASDLLSGGLGIDPFVFNRRRR